MHVRVDRRMRANEEQLEALVGKLLGGCRLVGLVGDELERESARRAHLLVPDPIDQTRREVIFGLKLAALAHRGEF